MVEELLKGLINAESTAESGELETAEILRKFFSDHNIISHLESWQQNRANLTVHLRGNGERPGLLFATHIDVVPPGLIRWQSPPFEATVLNGRIYGRGACDMKGGNAAAAVAIAKVIESGAELKGDLIFAATAGEETDSCGAERFMETCQLTKPDLAGVILPEPTDFSIITAHRGIFWVKITTHGKTAHGSCPQLGVNAINSMLKLLNKVHKYRPSQPEHPKFGPVTVSINTIHAGNATNVIPDKCSAEIDIRVAPSQSAEKIEADLRGFIAELEHEDENFSAELDIIRKVPPMETDVESSFVGRMLEITGRNSTEYVGYTTDGPHFVGLNVPVVVYGPGKSELAHKPDEYIDIPDLHKAVEVYEDIIRGFLT